MRAAGLIVVAACGRFGFQPVGPGRYARPQPIYLYTDVAPDKTVAIADNAPIGLDDASHFAIVPDLAATTGLAFDPATGVISGKPTKTSPSTRYVVTATSDDGDVTAAVTIRTAPGFYVTDLGDDNDDDARDNDCITAAGRCSFRAATEQLQQFDQTIRVALLPAGTIRMISGDVAVANPLELIGAGQGVSVIDASHASRAIDAGIENTLIVSDVTFRNGQGSGDGGCLVAEGGSVSLTRVTFEDCAAAGGGGAAWIADNFGSELIHIAITESTFTRNTASSGGALFVEDSYPGASLTISSSTFSNNTAMTSGAAIYDGGGPLALGESLFDSNGGSAGGAVWFEDGVVATLINCTFLANTNTGVATNNGSNVTLINDTIVDNTCSTRCYSGAGISQNSGGMLTLRNTIVANNIDLEYNARANFRAAGTMMSLGYNLTDSPAAEMPFVPATGDLVALDPQLGPLADNGGATRTLAITASSPAYNAGTLTQCPAIDQRGFPRPAQGACDIGAFELQ